MDYKEKATILRVCSSKKGERCSRCPAFGQGDRHCMKNAMKDGAAAITDLLARAESAKAEAEQLRNEHMKIQYNGEELTVSELCTRLREAEARAEKKIKQLTPCDRCAYDPPSSGDGKPCSFCPASKKED